MDDVERLKDVVWFTIESCVHVRNLADDESNVTSWI